MKKLQGYALLGLLFLSCKLFAQSGSGTASFTSNVFTENFDGFTSTACPCNGMPAGWYVYDGLDSKWNTGTGTVATGDLYLLGLASPNTDKALGGLRTTVAPMWGVNVTNNTGTSINSLRIQYTGEAWRVINRGTPDKLDFQYNIGGGTISDAAGATGWVNADPLDFRTLPLAAGATTTTGAANSSLFVDYTITGISIPAGTTVFFRWIDSDVTGNDDATAIDDLTITANPSCGGGTTYISQNFEDTIPAGSCWSGGGMAVSGTNAIYENGSGRTTSTAAVAGSAADQLKANITQTGLYSDLSSAASSTLTWEFTVRTEAGLVTSTSNLWGYFLYTNQSNLISTTSNTGYAVGLNLGSTSDKTIKLYKLNAQRWDAAAITTLITSGYVYPASAATQIDRNVTIKVIRTGNNTAATWTLYINNVLQGASVADASPVLPANTTTPSFTSGFFNIHSAAKLFVIDNITVYKGERPCNSSSSVCRIPVILPLDLIYFKGSVVGETTELNWQVSSETSARVFEIERSMDGSAFEKIGTTPVSNSQNQYRFSVPQELSATYYRLKMTDYSGLTTYSGIIQITAAISKRNKLLISPNPVLNDTKIIFSKSETGLLQVLNSTGQLLFQQKVYNQQQASLSTQFLSKGNYIITFSDNFGITSISHFLKL